MRAVVYVRYGPPEVLRLTEVPAPVPARGEVLVRVTRAALNPKDALTRKGRFRRLSGAQFPKRSGMDFAGVVEESRAPDLQPGQRVFGFLTEIRYRRGTLAERVVCAPNELAAVPDGVTDDDACASALVGLTALQALRDIARVQPGQRVLINGGSGGVGTVAIQVARQLGAEVDTISSAANEPLCAELGARRTWSYPAHQWRQAPPFDVIFDVFGNLAFGDVRARLAPRGCYVSTVPSPRRFVRDVVSRLAAQQERLVVVRPRRLDLDVVAGWLASGALRMVIDATYPIDRVAEAFERLETKRTRGKIVIVVA